MVVQSSAFRLFAFLPFCALVFGLLGCAASTADNGTGSDGGALADAGESGALEAAAESSGSKTCVADLLSDPANCGACGHACPVGQGCQNALCTTTCTMPSVLCPGSATCIDTSRDIANCGGCGQTCSVQVQGDGGAPGQRPATAGCVDSACVQECPSDPNVQACPDGCFDVTVSATHCGSCFVACDPGQNCIDGTCCAADSQMCNGTCVDMTSDPANCGSCNNVCNGGGCVNSHCVGYATSTSPAIPFVDACSLTGHASLLKDNSSWTESAPVALPFPFTFFGQSQTTFWLGNQGTLGFGSQPATSTQFPTCPLPDSANAFAAVVAFGDSSLVTGDAGICYGTTGTKPNRKFVVTWEAASEGNDEGSVLTFSILLDEHTSEIDVLYGTAKPGSTGGGYVLGNNATVGLQSDKATASTPYFCGQGVADMYNSVPLTVRFTPM